MEYEVTKPSSRVMASRMLVATTIIGGYQRMEARTNIDFPESTHELTTSIVIIEILRIMYQLWRRHHKATTECIRDQRATQSAWKSIEQKRKEASDLTRTEIRWHHVAV